MSTSALVAQPSPSASSPSVNSSRRYPPSCSLLTVSEARTSSASNEPAAAEDDVGAASGGEATGAVGAGVADTVVAGAADGCGVVYCGAGSGGAVVGID